MYTNVDDTHVILYDIMVYTKFVKYQHHHHIHFLLLIIIYYVINK
jgi:hypothetical protein